MAQKNEPTMLKRADKLIDELYEENDRLKIISHRNAPAIEVDNLRKRSIRPRLEAEPDARTGQVIAVQRLGNLHPLPEPERSLGILAVRLGDRPVGVLYRGVFGMRHIARVVMPNAGRQIAEAAELFDGVALGLRKSLFE